MEQESIVFLEKFVAVLCVHGVTSIPFTGDGFQQGVAAMEGVLHGHMDGKDFSRLSDLFVRVPVEETYQHIRIMFRKLHGYGISLSGVCKTGPCP